MDLSEAHILALEKLLSGNSEGFLTLNIGAGLGVSVLELIKSFENANNIKIPYIFSERRAGDVSSLVADNSKAKKILGWSPKRTLDEMCKDAWNWRLLNL